MTVKDLEKVQKTFKEAGQDYQVELESGKIIIVGSSDIVSSEIRCNFQLAARQLGLSPPFGSSF